MKLIDASLWIDLTRSKSPISLKQFVAPYVLDPDACVAEPVTFELLRFATDSEAELLRQYFDTCHLLQTQRAVWGDASELGRRCRKKGFSPGPLDLLIAAVAIDHAAELMTFDEDFLRIAECSKLKVRRLVRPE